MSIEKNFLVGGARNEPIFENEEKIGLSKETLDKGILMEDKPSSSTSSNIQGRISDLEKELLKKNVALVRKAEALFSNLGGVTKFFWFLGRNGGIQK